MTKTTFTQKDFEDLQNKLAALEAAQSVQPDDTKQPSSNATIIVSKPEEPKGVIGFIKKNAGKLGWLAGGVVAGYIVGRKSGLIQETPKVIEAVDVTDSFN